MEFVVASSALPPLAASAALPPLAASVALPPLAVSVALPPLAVSAALPPLAASAALPPLALSAALPSLAAQYDPAAVAGCRYVCTTAGAARTSARFPPTRVEEKHIPLAQGHVGPL